MELSGFVSQFQVPLWRQKDTYTSYFSAYELSNEPKLGSDTVLAYASAVSLVLLVLHFVGFKIFRKAKVDSEDADETNSGFRKHIQQLGGVEIFVFMVIRLVLALALTVLTVVTLLLKAKKDFRGFSAALGVTSIYTTVLIFLSLVTPVRWSSIFTRHENTLFLLTSCIFGYRDLYPAATFNLAPLDASLGWFMWAELVLALVLAVVIPLAIPRRYIPLDPKDPSPNPAPEQTASLFSLLFYIFIEPVVFEARKYAGKKGKEGHLPYEKLPPLADYDYAKNLRSRAFKHIDIFSGLKKKRHLFFSLMRVFGWDYFIMALMTAIQALTDLSIPIGVNQLLKYIETNGAETNVRPWVWVLWLTAGPTISSVAFEWYIFVGTRCIVHTESIITQAVFEHALRIRVKAEASSPTSSMEEQSSSALPTTSETASLADTPSPTGSGSQDGEEVPASDDSDDETLRSAAHSRDTTLRASTASTLGGQSHAGSLKGVPPSNAKSKAGTWISTPATKAKAEKGEGKEKEKEKAADASKNLVGKLNNLVSTDLQNIVDAKDFIRLLVLVPVQVVLCVWFLYNILGWSAFVGLGVIIVCFPVPGFLTKLIQRAQKSRMKKTDARVQVVSEIMNVLRMIKMFGWERKMYERIFEKREEEISFIKRLRLLNMTTAISNHIITVLTMLATFATLCTLVMGQELTASKVFSSMVVFDKFSNLLRMMIFMTTMSLNGKVSLDRITDFLYDTELLDSWAKISSGADEQPTLITSPPPAPDAIGFRNATFSWSAESGDDESPSTPSKRKFLLRIQDELLFKRGVLNMIVGVTGSGKTSVLHALLSEMHFMPSGPDSWYGLPRAGGVAYAAQESWVQNATIRDNIVFGAEFDEERYNKVIHQCCLERDLELFDAGDQTEVGEKGLTLSGGQKARVTLARAVYSKAEILLLDDVLAALDVHTSKWIVDKCLKGDLIRGRTVLLVTHNVVLVQPVAKFVVTIKDGRIASQTSVVEDAIAADETLAAEVEQEAEAVERADEEIDPQAAPNEPSGKAGKDGKLILEEEVQVGHVSWSALNLFFKAMGGNHVLLFFFTFIMLFFSAELAENLQTYFLGWWARQYEKVSDPSEVNVPLYLAIYVAILGLLILTFVLGFVVYLFGVLRASRVIHQQLITSVIGTTLRWLDTTPTSRVITRCTQDIRDIDDAVAGMLSGLIQMSLAMAIKFMAVIILTPPFLFPAALVAILGAWYGNVYIQAQLPVKREMSNAKAPVLGHFGAAMTGLTSIRAYGVQESFRKEVQVRIDYYSRPSRTFYNLNRWIDVRVDAISNVFAAALAAYLVYVGHDDASNVGFSLNMAVGFSGTILWWIRIVNQFEVRGNSLERIGAYIAIEQEKPPVPEGVPPAYWPASGNLRVEQLSASYSLDGPKVLKSLSFEVESGMRIGVVGRTGSGKSSLMLSLLRLIFSEGNVYYDGLETSSINLDELRRKITIIPQVPELLSGSVRENLDPFSQQDDATLNSALRSAGLFSLQDDMDEGEDRITLDSAVASGGNNLSVGQRQIIALARAMVRESKLLILDEATSAIDYKTDSIIQSSLRHELDKETTLIVVAHRLQTIMDADKIMVLDAGQIVEFDRPAELLKNKDGKLRALVDESADKDHLIEMIKAKEHLDASRQE